MLTKSESSDILVSVGIACYNQAAFLPATIQSVLNQSYPNIEIIIADDSSTDNTAGVVSPFLKDNRVRYHRNARNIGRVANYRNLLYELASGQWYINVDGDDQLVDNYFIEEAIRIIKKRNGIVLVTAGCKRVKEGVVEYIIQSSYDEEIKEIEGKEFFLNFKTKKSWISHLTSLYHVEKARSINFYNANIISSDYESLFRLCLLGNVISMRRVAGLWNIHGENESVKSKIDSDSILKNFEYIESAARFAQSYLSANLVRSWRNAMLLKEINNQFSFLLLFRPLNWQKSVGLILKKYTGQSFRTIPGICYSIVRKLSKMFINK